MEVSDLTSTSQDQHNVVKIMNVSTRITYLLIEYPKGYLLKVIQVSPYSDNVVDTVSRDMHSSKIHFVVVMGDFNAKLGKRYSEKLGAGRFGVGSRNHRGYLLAGFKERDFFI